MYDFYCKKFIIISYNPDASNQKRESPDSKFERSHVLVIKLVDICSSLQENPDNLLSATAHSIMQGSGISRSREF